MTFSARSGFSLIEALVVLAVGGMALAIIFSIGVKAGDTGFSLGRRALTAADSDVAASDLRTLIRSVALRPSRTFIVGVDQPVVGAADRLEADVVMERATQCAPQGWAGRMILSIELRGAEQVLYCEAGGPRAVLATVRPGQPAALSYSTDGLSWSPVFSNAPSANTAGAFQSERLFVRFSAPPTIDILESVSSSRPQLWIRPDAQF